MHGVVVSHASIGWQCHLVRPVAVDRGLLSSPRRWTARLLPGVGVVLLAASDAGRRSLSGLEQVLVVVLVA